MHCIYIKSGHFCNYQTDDVLAYRHRQRLKLSQAGAGWRAASERLEQQGEQVLIRS